MVASSLTRQEWELATPRLNISGFCSWVREDWSGRLISRLVQCLQWCNLHPYSHLWSWDLSRFGYLSRMPPGAHLGKVFQACITTNRPWGRSTTRWTVYISCVAWKCLGGPRWAEGGVQERRSRTTTWSWINIRKWKHGWMDGRRRKENNIKESCDN